MPDHARHAQPAPRLHALGIVVAAVKIRICQYRLPRHFIKRDVLRRKIRRAGDHQRIARALRVGNGPVQTLHGPQAAAHHRGKLPDPQMIGQTRLRVDPIFNRHQWKVRAPRRASVRVDRQRPGGTVTAAQIIHAHHEKPLGIERLAGAYHVVPPAGVIGFVGIHAGRVMRRIQRMAHQHRIRARGVERAVGFVGEFVVGDGTTALERQGLVKRGPLRYHYAYAGLGGSCFGGIHKKTR